MINCPNESYGFSVQFIRYTKILISSPIPHTMHANCEFSAKILFLYFVAVFIERSLYTCNQKLLKEEKQLRRIRVPHFCDANFSTNVSKHPFLLCILANTQFVHAFLQVSIIQLM